MTTAADRGDLAESLDRIPALRKAHTVYERFRRSGRPAPFRVRLLDARYHAQFRTPRPVPRRRTRGPRPDASPVVAAAIREAREAAGMSRRHLAATLGVTETAVRYWEDAKRAPAEERWVQLELTLGPLGVVRDPEPEPGQERNEEEAA
ncbi:MAG TPA: helix-turn-helix transcriptional regulator [Streptosporangiaceae bacterium]|nr:helix-turn-helix transcriptional regulator [Streptosporangiaceae bacterium]